MEMKEKSEIVDPLVSIIVITYNSAKYVLETLESAKAQTYQNIELIVSDDCSTDNTVEICRKWINENVERFVRTELVTAEKNTGIAPNCNRGLFAAKGEWVKFIAGDDILLPNCIADNINYVFLNKDAQVIFSISQLFKIVDNKRVMLYEQPLDRQKIWFEKTSNEQHNELLERNFVWTAATSFISYQLLKSMNYFDTRFPYTEDYPMWLKLTKEGHKLHFFEKSTALYRQAESITNNKDVWINKKYFQSLDMIFKILLTPELKKINYDRYICIKRNLLKKRVLINLFRNKKSISARMFNKLYDKLIPNNEL